VVIKIDLKPPLGGMGVKKAKVKSPPFASAEASAARGRRSNGDLGVKIAEIKRFKAPPGGFGGKN
jgi:hypothetical protein